MKTFAQKYPAFTTRETNLYLLAVAADFRARREARRAAEKARAAAWGEA